MKTKLVLNYLRLTLWVATMLLTMSMMSLPVYAATSDLDAAANEVNMDSVIASEVFSLEASEAYADEIAEIVENTPVVADKVSATSSTVLKSSGTYPTRYGVILVTADKFKGIIPTGHAAIIWTASTVVESLANGVQTGPNNWNKSKTTCYGISTNGTTAAQDNTASNWCHAKIGKPYNFNYFDTATRSKFYCSQLVWAAFKDLYGINMNTVAFVTPLGNPVHPMELVASSTTYVLYQL